MMTEDIFSILDCLGADEAVQDLRDLDEELTGQGMPLEVILTTADSGVTLLTGVSPADVLSETAEIVPAAIDVAEKFYTDLADGELSGEGWLDIRNDQYHFFTSNVDDVVTDENFSADGKLDLKNNVVVEGNVHQDIQFTEQQTNGSCSLMAQEQFVHRYTGQPIPEEFLEWQAEKWGVYSPDLGTDVNGQTMVLDYFNIPYERSFGQNIDDLNQAVMESKDVIIGVDSREFYESAQYSPGSGHAVAVVGRGLNPETNEVEGFYITDSNYPKSAHFVPVEKLQKAWFGDMISVPSKSVA